MGVQTTGRACASRAVFVIWLYYKTNRVAIDYLGPDGTKKARMFSTAKELGDMTQGNAIDWDNLYKAIHFEK